MYADRHARRMKLDPGSLGLSAAMVAVMIGGLIFSAPDFIKIPETSLEGWNIPVAPPPPPPKPEPLPKQAEVRKARVDTHIIPPPPKVSSQTDAGFTVSANHGTAEITGGTGTGIVDGSGEVAIKAPPVIVAPGINPRFNYQPDYPANERRLGREGRVVVRVLVGTDGRVKEVEKISAASDSFFEATRRRALEKWRLTPGTRDGVPVEAWRTMSVSFVMNDE